jgi:hypothetical protein
MNDMTREIFKLPEEFIIRPSESVKKLEKLKYDPIEKLTELYDRITYDMNNMMYDSDGEPKAKFSQVAYASLLAIQSKIANDLLRYAYKKVPETIEFENNQITPISIVLTKEKFEA